MTTELIMFPVLLYFVENESYSQFSSIDRLPLMNNHMRADVPNLDIRSDVVN